MYRTRSGKSHAFFEKSFSTFLAMRWTLNAKGHTPSHLVHGVQISAQGIRRDPYFSTPSDTHGSGSHRGYSPAAILRHSHFGRYRTFLTPSPHLRHQKNYVLHGQFLHALPMTTTARFNLLFTLYPLFLLFHKVRHPRTESATRNHVYPEHPF